MNYKILILSLAVASLVVASPTEAQARRRDRKTAKTEKTEAKDSTDKKPAPCKGPVSMDKFMKKDAKVMQGMTPVIMQDDKYFLEVPDSILGKDILMVARISQGAADVPHRFDGYAGDEINEMVVRFEKGPRNKIFIREISYSDFSKEGAPMCRCVKNSNLNTIVNSFDVKAFGKDSTSRVIDVTDFFNSDNAYLYFDKRSKKEFGIAGLDKSRSYISSVKTFPINTEVKTVKTYNKSSGDESATFELNCSFVLLPEKPMIPRYFDDRVGYFTVSRNDFDKDPQGVKRVRMITRWRLEPKPEDVEKYKLGELVEPAHPIVYYIDPSTPAKWIPYLIAGVNDWQKAFEQAGFKNAIHAEVAPAYWQDSTFSLEDARHSAIVYKPSTVENAMGPHVSDPRTGEIIESHVSWYHNVMKLLRDWYFVQCSPVDTAARHIVFNDELMGNLIRFVSSHEIGHTLGLRHNFIGSNWGTAAQLRDSSYLRKYGHATSIMDYARFDYVAQPGDNIPEWMLFPRINDYDKWAIEWGYKRYITDKEDPDSEIPAIDKLIRDSLAANPRLAFGTESSVNDPRLQSEDIGADQMETNALGIKNLKYIMDNLEEWSYVPDEDYTNLTDLYDQIVVQYRRYVGHVAKWVGGVYETPRRTDDGEPVREFVGRDKQKEAMRWLDKYLFQVPAWIVPDNIVYKTVRKPEYVLDQCYSRAFRELVSKRTLMNINEDMMANGSKAYSMDEYFEDLNRDIMGPLPSDQALAAYKRVEQKAYVQALCGIIKGEGMPAFANSNPGKDDGDAIAVAYYQLTRLRDRMNNYSGSNMVDRAHYKYLVKVIDATLDGMLKKGSK